MKWFLVFTLISFFSATGNLTAAGNFESSEPDSVTASPIMSTSDYFWQSGWNYSTLDRMSVAINSGEYGLYGPQPDFMLDGIPFEPTFFGISYSQLFPVPYFQSQKSELYSGHGVQNGVNYQTGLMHIISEPVSDGISVFGSGQYGHNSGEPGPWVFNPERVSPNVERFGPWVNGGLSMKFGNWYAKGILKFQEYKHVDEFVQLRMINSRRSPTDPTEWLGVDTRSVMTLAETGLIGSKGTLKLQAYQAESEDFLYFQPFGREVPAGFQVNQYSALADVKIHSRVGLRSLYQYREQELKYRENRFEYNFNWRKQMNSLRASIYYSGERFFADAGGEWQKTELNAPGFLGDDQIISALFLKQTLQIFPRVSISTTTQIQFSETQNGLQAGGEFLIDPVPFWTIQLGGSYSELLPELANPLEHQVQNGYYIFEHLDIPFDLPDQIETTRTLSLRNSHLWSITRHTKLQLDLEWFRHIAMNIPFQPVLYDLEYSTQPGEYSLLQGIEGRRLRAGLELRFMPLRKMEHRVAVTVNRTLSGDEEYEAYWQMIPEILAQYSIHYSPFPDVDLSLYGQYRSATTWSEFANLDGELNRTFHIQYPFRFFDFSDSIPAHVNIDLKMGKWFWNQRLRGEFLLKNLLNREYQTHPLGMREKFGYMARIELRF